jgi:peptidoglycan/LPS O-acetylase OafA/YrhL
MQSPKVLAGATMLSTVSSGTRQSPAMTPAFSVYLDLLRFVGALLVLFSHIETDIFGLWFWQLRSYGPQGVVIFFVMSGYVIAYTADAKNKTLRDYTIARGARLYSVVVPAIIFTVITELLIRHFDASYFLQHAGQDRMSVWTHAFLNLTYTSQLWFIGERWWTNLPFWSLGYEAWYYVIFAAATYFPGRLRFFLVLLTCVIAGPRILVLFPLWLLGVAAYEAGKRWTIPVSAACALFAISALGSVYLLLADTDASFTLLVGKVFGDKLVKTLLPPNFDFFYLLGIAITANILAFALMRIEFKTLLRAVGGPIRYAAGATFAIYLFHTPVLALIHWAFQGSPPSLGRSLLLYAGLFVILFAIAEVTERRKKVWTRLFNGVFAKFGQPSRFAAPG